MSSIVNSFSVGESNDCDFVKLVAATGDDTITGAGSTSGGGTTTGDGAVAGIGGGSLVGAGPEYSGFVSK
jgi:hypothetical protein